MTEQTLDWVFPSLEEASEAEAARKLDQSVGNMIADSVRNNIVVPDATDATTITSIAVNEDAMPAAELNETPIIEEAPTPTIEEQQAEKIVELEQMINTLQAEKMQCNEVLNTLTKKMSSIANMIDEEMLELINEIIKKITYKMIGHEVKSDPGLLTTMIQEMKTLLNDQQGVINIFISANDHQLIHDAVHDANEVIKIDPALSSGDIIIKSKYTEVRGLLMDRIDQLMRVDHD